MEVEGPLFDEWPPASHQVLFDDLEMIDKPLPANRERPASRGDRRRARAIVPTETEAVSSAPEQDIPRLMQRFMQQVYREPFSDEEC